ncbi:MAG: hypothetical protein HYW57_01090 [Ignavibacteriales bacterium]|nr:hypothetical protein [Ignavibacteriales bacterium]
MTTGTEVFDLAIAWTWPYDREFVQAIEEHAARTGVTTYVIQKRNLEETLEKLRKKHLQFRCILDRASDEDEAFHPLHRFLSRQEMTRVVNPLALQQRSADKATMHLEFLTANINVPYTIIISPYNQKNEAELSLTELAHLGRPFIIKPANTTGGGIGVVLGAETLKDVLDARLHHKNDKYLLQETIKPAYVSEQRAWFRVLYAFGTIIPCWWDDQTHVYELVTAEEEETFGLAPLREMTQKIRSVCRLDFFSTELVYTYQEKFVVVDYVNEICDMRFQSSHRDGVPDEAVQIVIRTLLDFVKSA